MYNEKDEHAGHIATPTDFASEQFAMHNQEVFDQYIELRMRGINTGVAYRMVLGEEYADNLAQARIYAIEMNPYFKRTFKALLASTPTSDLWNARTSAHELLCIVRDRFEKGSTRLNAIKELNVMADITIVDENGRTKAGRSLADFYATEAQKPAVELAESELPGETPKSLH